MKLYSYWRSTSSWRVRIALHHKQIPFEYVPINLLAGQQVSAEHRARSPMAKIPVLELDDGKLLTESMAILEFLEEVYPTPPLLPGDSYLRARARMLAEMVNSGIQPYQNMQVQKHLKNVLHADEKPWLAHWIGGGLADLERAVEATAGTFCVGVTPTLADVCLVPQLAWARRMELDLSAVPKLVAIDAACSQLPAFIAAAGDNQPDSPKQ